MMTPSARFSAVLELLHELDAQPRPADALAGAYFRARRYIGAKDRSAISALYYALLRTRARLGWWIEKMGVPDGPRARLLAYLKLEEKRTDAEVNGLFDGRERAPAPLDEQEKRFLRALKGHTLFHPEMSDQVRFECPTWAYDSFLSRFGNDLNVELEALLAQAPLDLRVNPLKTTRDDALATLEKLGLKPEKTPYSPFCLRVHGRPPLGRIALLKEGALEIQDEGSQLVALLCNPKPKQRVCDFCAGAGGKTLALSALMGNKGRIVACDVLEKRLKRSGERFRRAGLHNIETKPLSGERDPWVKHHKESFDCVLIDAPCSGTGTWRRNPDSRWRSLGPGLEALLPLQASILESAARLVKKGGRLVYATCSLLPQENEEQVRRFLGNHLDFSLTPVRACGIEGMPDTGDFLSLSPAKHGTDGFFAAALKRKEADQ